MTDIVSRLAHDGTPFTALSEEKVKMSTSRKGTRHSHHTRAHEAGDTAMAHTALKRRKIRVCNVLIRVDGVEMMTINTMPILQAVGQW
jgi:hypothetical protein